MLGAPSGGWYRYAMAAAAQTASSGAPTEDGVPSAQGREALPPGPSLPPVVQSLAWGLAPTWLMDHCARRWGDTFTLRFPPGGAPLVHLSDPQDVKTLLTASEDVAPKPTGGAGAPVWVLGPNSLSVLTGPEHMRQRKLLLPPFHGEHLRKHEDLIVGATRRVMADWPLGRAMRMQPRTRLITLEVIMGSVFGVEAERMEEMQKTIVALMGPKHVIAGLRMLVRPTQERPNSTIGRGLDRLDGQIYAEIANRRAQSDLEGRSDIMSMLLVARDEDGTAMTDEEVRDELVTLLLAGHETTATAVSWAIERLVRHPEALARLVGEIDAQRDGGGDEYLVAVINETLRVRPPQGIVVRTLKRELQVGRFVLPAGTTAAISVYATNRNRGVYADPAAFRPERFLENGPETYSWVPFGGGIRRCIGSSLALLEAKLILRTMLAELEPRVPDGRRGRRGERMRWSHRTLIPSRDATVVWRRRSPHAAAGAASKR
jgi:cytochrome P450